MLIVRLHGTPNMSGSRPMTSLVPRASPASDHWPAGLCRYALVEEGEVPGPDDAAAAGHADGDRPRVVEREERLDGDVLGDAAAHLRGDPGGHELLVARRVADGDDGVDAVLLALGDAEQQGQPERLGDEAMDGVGVRLAGQRLDGLARAPSGPRSGGT